ncbi:hypothetical protein DMB90_09770 [Raoultella planticola]|uniref:Uncharacterized protein n=1 Tax=Raoultella planticola TaxID=575 RepID=A0A5P6AA22_RAOPL|nr:hypothetical protein DMB90_09770 [Raoultella planticola]
MAGLRRQTLCAGGTFERVIAAEQLRASAINSAMIMMLRASHSPGWKRSGRRPGARRRAAVA